MNTGIYELDFGDQEMKKKKSFCKSSEDLKAI